MKKRKLLLSVLTAAVFATSAGALVACGDGLDLPENGGKLPIDTSKGYTVTFVPGADAKLTKIQGNALPTDKEGKLTATTMPEAEKNENNENWNFLGWGLAAGQTAPTITAANFKNHKFEEDTYVYAVFKEKDDQGGGGDEDEEYIITLDATTNNGTCGMASVVTVDKKLPTLPDATRGDDTFNGWFTAAEGGTQVYEGSTVDGTYTVIYAQFTEQQGGDDENVDPDPPARVYNAASINDQAMEDVTSTIDRTWVEYPDWSGYQNHTLADQFKAVLEVTEVTTYTFKVGETTADTAANDLWIEFATGLELKIDGTIATQNKNGSSVTLAAGTYTIYLKKYSDGGVNLWIEGTKTGEWGGGGQEERPEIDPNPPARVYNAASINDQAMQDVTSTIDRTYKVYDDWEGYQNHTLADQFKAELEVTEVTTYTFKVGATTADTAANDLWIEFADGLEIKINGTIAAANKNGSNITLAAGTYTIYLKKYSDGGVNLWIEGTKTGEWGGGGQEERPETDPNPPASTVTAATINDEAMERASINRDWTDDEENENGGYYNNHTMTDQFKADLNVTEVTTYTFKADGTDLSNMWIEFAPELEFKIDGVLATVKKNGTSLTFAPGNYTVYLKKFMADGDFCLWVQGTKTGEWGGGGGGEQTEKENGVYDGDTKLEATVVVNPGNANELMITGLVLTAETNVSIVYNNAVVTIGKNVGSGGDIGAIAADGKSVTLSAGTYELYYSFGGDSATKLWAIRQVEGPSTNKNAALEAKYETNFKTGENKTKAHVVGKFYSRAMSSYAWDDGYLMDEEDGGWTLKNIYLYEGDCLKVRSSCTDGNGTNAATSAQIEIFDMSMRIKAGGEGYYTITYKNGTVTVTFHGATAAA